MAGSSRNKDLEETYANLSLNNEEDEGLVLEDIPESDEAEGLERCLVGRFLTNKKVNFVAMQDTLSSIWRPVKGVFMEETTQLNMFLFKFFHDLDLQRALDDGPWTFNQQALLIRKLNAEEQIKDVKLSELYIWVQIYDVPIGFKSEFILKFIGNYVGCFMETDPKNFQGMCRNYMRIRVAIDVGRPLKKQMKIKKAGGEWIWVQFKYEHLPSFCFYCGRIGHTEKFCEDMFDNHQRQEVRRYDSSICAPSRNQYISKENQWIRNSDGMLVSPAGVNGKGKKRVEASGKQDKESNENYANANHNPNQSGAIITA